jgi:hypothetical protein
MERGEQTRVLGLPQEVDVQLEPSALDVRAREDAVPLPLHDRASGCGLRWSAACDKVLELPEERHQRRVLPVEIGLDALEVGQLRRASL